MFQNCKQGSCRHKNIVCKEIETFKKYLHVKYTSADEKSTKHAELNII